MFDSTFTTAMNACKQDRQNTIRLLKRADKEEKQGQPPLSPSPKDTTMRAVLTLCLLALMVGDMATSGIMPTEDDLSDDDLRQFFEGMLGLSDDQAKAAEQRMSAGLNPVPDTEVERLMTHIAQRPREEDPATADADAAAPAPEKAGDADMSEQEATDVLSSIFSDLITTVVKPAADAEAQPEQAHKLTQEARRAALQRAQEEQDANDDFCFACGGGGDLLLCDKCVNSYHMHCLDPPLQAAPEGEWACPAHKPGRKRSKELGQLERDQEMRAAAAAGGFRPKPPRTDARYQASQRAICG